MENFVYDHVSNMLLKRVIVCTCLAAQLLVSLGHFHGHFTHMFIDEAGQALEAETLVGTYLLEILFWFC